MKLFPFRMSQANNLIFYSNTLTLIETLLKMNILAHQSLL